MEPMLTSASSKNNAPQQSLLLHSLTIANLFALWKRLTVSLAMFPSIFVRLGTEAPKSGFRIAITNMALKKVLHGGKAS